jgi:integrase/recombinase XerD
MDSGTSTGTALPPAIARSVSALPALPPLDASQRYGVRRLTATWLAGFAPHTRRAYFRDLAHFLAWCQRQGLDPRTARSADIDHYRATLQQVAPQNPLSPATVHRRLSALSSWYRYLVANGDGAVPVNPMAGVRRPRVDRDASTTAGLTADQVRALLHRSDQRVRERADAFRRNPTPHRRARHLAAARDRALIRLLADLGLRIGEALGLDLDALTHNNGVRTVRYRAKGGHIRERPLSPQVSDAINDYLAARATLAGARAADLSGPLFATSGRDGQPGRLGEPAAFLLVRKLATGAGLSSAARVSPHSLRHAFATNARELGIPLEDVQDAMGHADARTTRRYDRGRFALHRDPALKLANLYSAVESGQPNPSYPSPQSG